MSKQFINYYAITIISILKHDVMSKFCLLYNKSFVLTVFDFMWIYKRQVNKL